jgi:outer membrane protein assembly factor BamE (lipoprotein component of BamABCDE complex)
MIRLLILLSVLTVSGCMSDPQPLSDRNSQLTQGNVQMNVVVGKTTKIQILETFGAPNITTRESSRTEVWTYQRAGQASQASSVSGGWTVIFAGSNYSKSGFESSSRMITLIIKFNSQDIVSDFASRTSNF